MPDGENSGVRPTKRCLDDLGIAFPSINQPLYTIDHPLINKAQHLPAEVSAGGAERIKALTDRVWFKVKVVNLRGAATRLTPSGAKSVGSTHLLPQPIDYTRLRAESLLRVQIALQNGVRRLIYRSLKTGKIWEAEYERHTIKACVRAEDGAYVAIATEGFLDPRLMAVILAAVPGLTKDDWLPEPGG